MENLSYVGLSRQVSLWRQMEVTANNMANVNTPGYKAQKILFSEYMNKNTQQSEFGATSQVQMPLKYTDMSQGSLRGTHNNLDVALNGDGYFAIQTANGVKYTRDGSFQLNENRQLITKSGDNVLDDGGSPIEIPENAVNINITRDGMISAEDGEIASLKVVDFENKSMLRPVGGNLIEANGAAEKPVEFPMVQQGMLEDSNVEAVFEMNQMIELQRMFEMASNIMRTDHERQRNTIKTLTQA